MERLYLEMMLYKVKDLTLLAKTNIKTSLFALPRKRAQWSYMQAKDYSLNSHRSCEAIDYTLILHMRVREKLKSIECGEIPSEKSSSQLSVLEFIYISCYYISYIIMYCGCSQSFI